ncbi:uncharacterized protein LAJ45_04694 [Morchella importuna]|uniref:uncharacterized protein n=1 Tax=Morchella importuna TaxID=1174673 RepID=UPI001E8EABE9|nr:uncharacterized protein LAJ45_04694 [Morchella importuna]KAH8151489.1 hypothetical protein LAJ45_04694 [Morchella importuna]
MSALPPPLSNIATPDTVPIGALFVNPQDLYEDLHDSFPTRTDLPTSIVIKPFGIYKTSSTMNKTSKLRSTLVDLLAHTRHSTDTSASELSASEGERHTILSHPEFVLA